jgi:hypothetical protein
MVNQKTTLDGKNSAAHRMEFIHFRIEKEVLGRMRVS